MNQQLVLISALHISFFLFGTFLLALTISIVTQLLGRRFSKSKPDDHWTIKARLQFPVKRIRLFNMVFLLILIPFLGQKLFGANLLVPDGVAAALSAVTIFWGLKTGTRLFEKRGTEKKRPLITFATYAIVVAFNILIFFVYGMIMPDSWGLTGVLWVIAVLASSYAGIKGLGIWASRHLGLVYAPTQELEKIVGELSTALNLTDVKVWIAKSDSPNAFAYPWLKTIICTDSLLTALDKAEVRAVCAHELGHVAEGKAIIRRRLLAIWLFSLLLISVYLFKVLAFSPWVTIAATWGSALFIIFASQKFARKQEVAADAVAHQHDHPEDAGESKGAYARGLEKIYRLNEIPAVLSKRQTHPSLYDRMLAAGVTPDFERPEKPSAKLMWIGILLNTVLAFAICSGWIVSANLIAKPSWSKAKKTQRSIMTKMVLSGSKPIDLASLGWSAIDDSDFEQAEEWFELAKNIAPQDYQVITSIAYGYAVSGDCKKAEEHWGETTQLLAKQKDESSASKISELDQEWFDDVGAYIARCETL